MVAVVEGKGRAAVLQVVHRSPGFLSSLCNVDVDSNSEALSPVGSRALCVAGSPEDGEVQTVNN